MSPSDLALLLSDRSPQQFGQKHTQMCCRLVNLEGELVLKLPGRSCSTFPLHRNSAHKAFLFQKPNIISGAATWEGLLKSCIITINISDLLTVFHLNISWTFVC